MRITLLLLLSLCVLKSIAREQPPHHIPLMNSIWDLMETKTYYHDKSGATRVSFPPDLKLLNKKDVELPGYMIPIKTGLEHQDFLLSVLPVLQCQFCGQAKIPSMVAVHLNKPVPYTEKPIRVKGMLLLNGGDDSMPEFFIINGVLEEIK